MRAKVWILAGFILLLFGILVVQLVRLQILRHDEFVARAVSNRVRTIDIAPSRGLIYDRDGNLLVENSPAYQITLVSADIPDDDVSDIAQELAEMFDISAWDVEQRIWDRKYSNDPFLPLLIAEDPTAAQVIDVTSRRSALPGVRVETVSIRRYEQGRLLGHILGYVGKITAEEYEELSDARYLYSDQIGRAGVEAAYERQLRGSAGRQLVEVDAVGNVLRALDTRPPTPGLSAVLTIDIELQQRIEDILLEHQGASLFASAVVLDVHSGEVLAMVSVPNYDVNIYEEITTEEYQELLHDPGQPLTNQAIQAQFPPGSIFKIVTAVAGLAEGAITPETKIYSPGVLEVHNELSPGIIYRFGDTDPGRLQHSEPPWPSRPTSSSTTSPAAIRTATRRILPDIPSSRSVSMIWPTTGVVAGDVEFAGAGNEALAHWAQGVRASTPRPASTWSARRPD